ncbi:hypothetical protein [Fundidesulfovibrio putealis]|uniref:hypothetical protein n=1 Tax=Fundidesulfovibrio putealis TaxID=270496 RepID=UPI0012EBD4EE|nr:hypothetical protein [Fundidesulfovibrio putealis]
MGWEEVVKFSLAVFSAAVSISAAVAWLTKKLFSSWFDKSLEKYKAKLNGDIETHRACLKRDADEYQARISFELSRIDNERSFRFSKLHEERLEVIKSMYGSISCIGVYLESTLSVLHRLDDMSIEEMFSNVVDSYNELLKVYPRNGLFFSPELCALIDDFLAKMRQAIRAIQVYPLDVEHATYINNPLILGTRHEMLEGVRGKYRDEIKVLQERLAGEFRELLGVN